jgi:glucose-6-phosphate isomerase
MLLAGFNQVTAIQKHFIAVSTNSTLVKEFGNYYSYLLTFYYY